MRTVPVTALDADSFAPFGAVVDLPGRDAEASGPGWRWWAETAELAADERPFGIGYLALEPAPRRFDWAEQHLHSPELVVPLGGDCLVYAAAREEPDGFAVFRVRSGQAVVLAPGVWHGAPLALDRPLAAAVLLAAGTGTDDVTVRRFDDNPVEITDNDRE